MDPVESGHIQRCIIQCTLIMMLSVPAFASHHNWRVVEVFSNADGTLQFIQMNSVRENETNLSCCAFTSTNLTNNNSITYMFPSDLGEDSLNRDLLLGTSGIESAFGIRPDYIIPDGYLFTGRGGIQYNEEVIWDELPTDGINSINISDGSQQIAAATPTNFNGESVTLPVDRDAPTLQIPQSLTIASNTQLGSDDARIIAHLDEVSCEDEFDDNPELVIDTPSVFEIGTTEVGITCTDAAGNEATGTTSIQLTQFADNDGDAIPDDDDPDDDNDGTPDDEDDFPFDSSESVDTDGDGIGNNADPDDDGDGTPDDEDAFPLDETESADADQDGIGNNADPDDDNDGIPDVDEDNTPPVITGTDSIVIDATGRLTTVSFAAVTATDDKDGDVTVRPDRAGPFTSGRHSVVWTATDSAGNEARVEQIIDIRPLLTVQASQTAAEGTEASFTIALSGPAPEYPVVLDYSIAGSADLDDIGELPDQLIIESGLSLEAEISILDDEATEENELLTFEIVDADQATIVENHVSHTLTITEANLSPSATILISQSGRVQSTLFRDDGAVVIEIIARDETDPANLIYEWSASSPELPFDGATDRILSFDPSILSAGAYTIDVTIGDGTLFTRLTRLIRVADSSPSLTAEDSDGDGIDDLTEGTGDADDDGIADYLDPNDDERLLRLDDSDDNLETTAGLLLRLGRYAIVSNNDSARIGTDVINVADAGFRLIDTLVDFDVVGVDQTAEVVIPLIDSIPANAFYRKYSDTTGWQEFVVGGADRLSSTSRIDGLCPPPTADSWDAGLNTDDECVRLTISDGGPNDADGRTNGTISDPGGIAVSDAPPTLTVPVSATFEASSASGIPADSSALQSLLSEAICTDNVDGELTVANDVPAGFLPLGETIVEFTCTDSANNEVTSLVSFSVDDTTPPSITVGSPLTITAESDVSSNDTRVTAFVQAVTCTDTVSNTVLANTVPSSLPAGTTTAVEFSCEDEAGNLATAQTSITVTAPAEQKAQSDRGAGCFIATAAYGSPLDPHVNALRAFRDKGLMWHAPGRMLTLVYYEYSPAVADIIATSPILMAVTRSLLTPLVFTLVFPLQTIGILLLIWLLVRRRRVFATAQVLPVPR